MTSPIIWNRRSPMERRQFNNYPDQERRDHERRDLHSWRYLLIIAGYGFDELDLGLLLPLLCLILFALFAPVGSLEHYFR